MVLRKNETLRYNDWTLLQVLEFILLMKIPNIFHFVFGLKKQTSPFHLAHYLCLESCLQVNQPDKIFFYYHYEPFGKYWDIIRDKLTLIKIELDDFVLGYDYIDKGVKKYHYAHQSDFIRLEQLLKTGGVYADMDTLFVNRLPEELFTKSFVLGREGDILDAAGAISPSLCNAFIMAEPNAKFGRRWLENMKTAFDGTWSAHSTLLPYQLSQKYPDLIHIEPMESFYKYQWTSADLDLLLQGRDDDTSDIYSIHLWSHLWWARSRRDLIDFHAGQITEKYIRSVDTTYNLIARRFLPQPAPQQKLDPLTILKLTRHFLLASIDAAIDTARRLYRALWRK